MPSRTRQRVHKSRLLLTSRRWRKFCRTGRSCSGMYPSIAVICLSFAPSSIPDACSQRQQEIVAKQREEESFKSAGATQVWKSQSGRASRQATAPKQRKKQAADAGEIMARLASEGRANARNKRPRSDEGAVPPSDTGSLPPSPGHAPGTRTHASTQATPASGPSASRPSQKPPPAKKQKQSRQRRGATFVVD